MSNNIKKWKVTFINIETNIKSYKIFDTMKGVMDFKCSFPHYEFISCDSITVYKLT